MLNKTDIGNSNKEESKSRSTTPNCIIHKSKNQHKAKNRDAENEDHNDNSIFKNDTLIESNKSKDNNENKRNVYQRPKTSRRIIAQQASKIKTQQLNSICNKSCENDISLFNEKINNFLHCNNSILKEKDKFPDRSFSTFEKIKSGIAYKISKSKNK